MLSINTGFVINLINKQQGSQQIIDKFDKNSRVKYIVDISDPVYYKSENNNQGNNNVNRRT